MSLPPMLRLHQSISAAQARAYYTDGLGRADYYGRAGQSPSAWFGRAAERLGLSGEVTKDAFFALLENRTPTGGKLTVRDRGDRRPGWDLTFSPPKGVSALRALTGDERINGGQRRAVKPKMQAVGACMRKLLLICYGVLKNRQPFDPNWSSKNTR